MNTEFAEWVGRSIAREDIVTPRLLAEYRATMAPFLFELGDAHVCPPGFHWGVAPATPFADETGPDGSEAKGKFLPPIPLSRRMWAGGTVETFRPIRLGAALRRVSAISEVTFREGRAGPFYLMSITHDIADGDGVLIRERQDLVFRDGAPKAVRPQAVPSASGGRLWTIDPSPLLLFRFSAFTFNGHRIHYDSPYAAEEGYAGLVVHGPLQAALMLNLAATAMGQVPRRFDYRCVAPLLGAAPFQVSAAENSLRVLRHDGVITAEGQAHAPGT